MPNARRDRLKPPPHSDQLPAVRVRDALNVTHELYQTLDPNTLTELIVQRVTEHTAYNRALLLLHDAEDATLVVEAHHSGGVVVPTPQFSQGRVSWQPDVDAIQSGWEHGEPAQLSQSDLQESSPLYWLMIALDSRACFSVPLLSSEAFIGVLLTDRPTTSTGAVTVDNDFLQLLAPAMASALDNACRYHQTVTESTTRLRQLTMLRQIDRELNDNIQLNHVFALTLDWALRYTNAYAASLAFYDEKTDELRYVADVGYALQPGELEALRSQTATTTAHRVARSGRIETIPDVSRDKDYLVLSPLTRSQLVAPITREDRVIAVICVESKKINHFTDDHVDFIDKLNARAGVAIDNARLFWETARERSKLERILRNTADIVIVVDTVGNVDILNTSALVAFELEPGKNYSGQPLASVIGHPDLLALYQHAVVTGNASIGEIVLGDSRTFYANLSPCHGIGWVIVMHDVSPLKKTDRLKNELIAAVSHDLKQPLGIMHGFTELIKLNVTDSEHVISLIPQIQRAISNMQQLIDDQLDLARLESGIQLQIEPVYVRILLADCAESLSRQTLARSLHIELSMPDDTLSIEGDRQSLYRIFLNIIGNAVKYTPEHGSIHLTVEESTDSVSVAIHDNGLGISPEDQTRVFERFYRVRRPEYDGIDGTGLGLAIVKRLVELHHGHIGLTSAPGEGSTFTVVLPRTQPAESTN